MELLDYNDIKAILDEQDFAVWDKDHADTFDIAGRTYKVYATPDDFSIMDEQGEGVWCGQLEWTQNSSDTGYRVRPYGFDGNAEVLDTDGNHSLWWQPLSDCKPNSEIRANVRKEVLLAIREGFARLVIEEPDGNHSAFGGLSWNGMEDVVPELAWEVHSDWQRKVVLNDLEYARSFQ